jgi:hypothetical protein
MLIFVWNMQRAEKTHQREKHKKWSAPEREAHGIGWTCKLMEETEGRRDWLVDGEDFVLLCYESEFYTKSPICPSVIEKRKV